MAVIKSSTEPLLRAVVEEEWLLNIRKEGFDKDLPPLINFSLTTPRDYKCSLTASIVISMQFVVTWNAES